MKVKLDGFYLGILINGLNRYRHSCQEDTETGFSDFLLRLVDEYEHLKPNHKKMLAFTPEETRLVREYLLAWRNEEIQAEKEVAVEVISETLAKFI